jgi:hypothetical protein
VVADEVMNKNFAVEGSYTDYSSDTTDSSMSAANGAALEAAIGKLNDTAGYKSLMGLTGTTLTGTGTTNAKITSFETLSSGRSIDLSGLYYFAQSDISTTDFIARSCSTSDWGQCTCIIILKCRRFSFKIPSANT